MRSTQHSKQIFGVLIITIFISLLIIAGIYAISVNNNLPIDFLTEDPLGVAEFPWYTGALSNLGMILWSVTLGACIVGAIFLQSRKQHARLLAANAALTVILVADDTFMIHEHLRDFMHIPEPASYGFYALIIVIYLVFFYRVILSDPSFVILVVALLFLGASVVLAAALYNANLVIFIKSGLKFIGIALWLAYNLTFMVRAKNDFRMGQQTGP